MDTTTIFTTILALVLIFLFAIQKFTHQIQIVAGEGLKAILNKWTNRPIKGIISGAFVTGILQSSTAASVILVGLVNGGLIPSYNAIAVIVGANVGSTITAQLIALNMTYVAPMVVIAGFIISHSHSRLRKYGKAVFYFGVIFLSLFIIQNLVEPLKDNETFVGFLGSLDNPYSAIIVGAVLTAIFQSSAVLTGLILILAGSGLVELPMAIGFLPGAAICPPTTAIIASMSATIEAKRVAIAHLFFNILGFLIFFPIVPLFAKALQYTSGDVVQQIVNAHFIFNITTAILCFVFFRQFESIVRRSTFAIYKK